MAQPAHTLSDVIRKRPVRAAARQASYSQSGRKYRVLAIRSGDAAWDPAAAARRASRAARSAELFMGRVWHALRHAALLGPAGHAYEAANEATAIALRDCSKPTIAAVSGYAMGWGCALALACDLRVRDATTRMGIPAARLGVVYGELDCALLYRQVGLANAKRVLYSGRAFDVNDCAAMGLVDEVAGDTALAGARGLALEIASNAPLSLAGSKLLLDALATDTVEARQAEILAIIEGAMNSADYREGARAFLEKRKPIFTGR